MVLTLAELADGTRVLLVSVTAQAHAALAETTDVCVAVPDEHRAQLGFDALRLVPLEDAELRDLVLRLEFEGLAPDSGIQH